MLSAFALQDPPLRWVCEWVSSDCNGKGAEVQDEGYDERKDEYIEGALLLLFVQPTKKCHHGGLSLTAGKETHYDYHCNGIWFELHLQTIQASARGYGEQTTQ